MSRHCAGYPDHPKHPAVTYDVAGCPVCDAERERAGAVQRLAALEAAARLVLRWASGEPGEAADGALPALRAALGEGADAAANLAARREDADLRALADLPTCHDCPIGNRAPGHSKHDPARGPCPRSLLCDQECGQEMAADAAVEGGER